MKKYILTPYNTSTYHTPYQTNLFWIHYVSKCKGQSKTSPRRDHREISLWLWGCHTFLKQTQKLLLTKKKSDKSTTLKFGNSTYEKTKHTQEHYEYKSKPQAGKIYLQ